LVGSWLSPLPACSNGGTTGGVLLKRTGIIRMIQ
jgi:hypothetical protein